MPTPHTQNQYLTATFADVGRYATDSVGKMIICLSVAGISRLQRQELNANHVKTVEDLSRLPLPLQWKPSRGAAEAYEKICEQARMQVTARAIPGIHAGTVDKFQGQEAPIVIYSMASSPDDAPRGMEFLYSLHRRLNVATSRARCACILVANPGLLKPDCRTTTANATGERVLPLSGTGTKLLRINLLSVFSRFFVEKFRVRQCHGSITA